MGLKQITNTYKISLSSGIISCVLNAMRNVFERAAKPKLQNMIFVKSVQFKHQNHHMQV